MADPIPLPPGQVSGKDALGHYTMNINFPSMPVTVRAPWFPNGKDYAVSYEVPIGPDVTLIRMAEFIGFNRGDIAEVDLECRSGSKGAALMQRSEHKEASFVSFDAWRSHDLNWKTSVADQTVVFHLFAHASGKNPVTGDDPAIHWGVRLELKKA